MMRVTSFLLVAVFLLSLSSSAWAFLASFTTANIGVLRSTTTVFDTPTYLSSSVPSDVSTTAADSTLDDLKSDLVRACTRTSKPLLDEIQILVRDLEDKAELIGVGQSSSLTGLLSGEWYVVGDKTKQKTSWECELFLIFSMGTMHMKDDQVLN
jgi:hypothetical protein